MSSINLTMGGSSFEVASQSPGSADIVISSVDAPDLVTGLSAKASVLTIPANKAQALIDALTAMGGIVPAQSQIVQVPTPNYDATRR